MTKITIDRQNRGNFSITVTELTGGGPKLRRVFSDVSWAFVESIVDSLDNLLPDASISKGYFRQAERDGIAIFTTEEPWFNVVKALSQILESKKKDMKTKFQENAAEKAYMDALELLKAIERNAIEDHDWIEDEYETLKIDWKRGQTRNLIAAMKNYKNMLRRNGITGVVESKEKNMKTITIQEETKIPQKDGSVIILEKGDKIRINEKYGEGQYLIGKTIVDVTYSGSSMLGDTYELELDDGSYLTVSGILGA
jgi:uncharacterized protein YqgV (UPF0045/DUF77 family)